MSKITEYYFQKATYLIRDKYGNELLLHNDYKNKKYMISQKKAKNAHYQKLSNKVSKIAIELLEKKHGVNFAYKFS